MEPLYTSIIGIARTLFVVQGTKFTITGAHNIPSHGGAVLVINHTGYLDFIYAGIPARRDKRLVRYMAKREVFDHPVTGPIMRTLRHIPVDRAAGDAAYSAAVAALRTGELVGVFPEATISRSFEVKEFKSGAVRMAYEAGVPVIPITMWGSQRVWTKGLKKNLVRPKVPILIEVGRPIVATEPPEECLNYLHSTMEKTLHRLQSVYERRFGPFPAGAPWLPRRLGGSAPTLAEATALDSDEHEERVRRRQQELAGGTE